MTTRKGLVLDANILLRAVFGQRVRQILEAYEYRANFYAPDVCIQDARKYIPDLSTRRQFDVDLALSARVQVLPRDPDDWPVAAVALLLGLPIWTEDQDSLAAVSRPGRPTGSSYFFEKSEYRLQFHHLLTLLLYAMPWRITKPAKMPKTLAVLVDHQFRCGPWTTASPATPRPAVSTAGSSAASDPHRLPGCPPRRCARNA